VEQGPRWQRRIAAAESANRLLGELEVDQTRRIDVFGLCEDLGLWLVFLPMDNLLGAYIPEGVGGVMITTARPVSVQRFTAAHELGHWRMDHGHGIALDGAEHILGRSPSEREQLAQFFAANLLMPPPLVYGVLERLALDGGSIHPEHVYAVAREAGVSYEAAARQLNNLDVITHSQLPDLLKPRPIKVKAALALGRRPVNGYADVWPVNEHWSDQVLDLRVEDEVVVSLPENRTTGYRWMFPRQEDQAETTPAIPAFAGQDLDRGRGQDLDQLAEGSDGVLNRDVGLTHPPATNAGKATVADLVPTGGVQVVGDDYLPSHSGAQTPARRRERRLELVGSSTDPKGPSDYAAGAAGRRLIGLRFPLPGTSTVTLEYRSPFSAVPAVDRYVLHALIEARHQGISVNQVARDSGEAWTDAARQRERTLPPDPLGDESTDDRAAGE
jgi:Zn-dependent peptidase ImmA (M78 family)